VDARKVAMRGPGSNKSSFAAMSSAIVNNVSSGNSSRANPFNTSALDPAIVSRARLPSVASEKIGQGPSS